MSSSSTARRPRGLSLVRLLIGAGAPLAAVSSVVAASLTALGGCTCPDVTTSFFIDEETYLDLAQRYGGEDTLPLAECERLCVSPRLVNEMSSSSSTSSSSAGGGDAGGMGGMSASGGMGGMSATGGMGGMSASGGMGGAAAGGGMSAAGGMGGDGGSTSSGQQVPETTDRDFLGIGSCHLSTIDWDHHAVTCTGRQDCGGAGRRPPGFVPHAAHLAIGAGEVARYLAEIAELEAASVMAFERLAEELALHGAPAQLIASARAAAREEHGHALATEQLARKYGYAPKPVEVRSMPLRGLLELALDNAAEGCVGEAYAAGEAAYAAEHARDPLAAAVWQRIAVEEAAHAALSFAIDDWARTKLGAAEHTRLDRQRRDALKRLSSRLSQEHSQPLQTLLGLPAATEAAGLLAALNQSLWHAAA